MITSSNFFRKTFFTLDNNEQAQTIKKEVGPWEEARFPKFATLDRKPNDFKRPYSLLKNYDCTHLDSRRKAVVLRKHCKKDVYFAQSSDGVMIQRKKHSKEQAQAVSNLQQLPQLKQREEASISPERKSMTSPLRQLEVALMKIKNPKSPYTGDLNFIRRSHRRSPKSPSLVNTGSFKVYQKCIKSVKKHRYLEPVAYSPAKRSIG